MSEKEKGSVLSLAEWRQTVQKKTAKECEDIGVYDCERVWPCAGNATCSTMCCIASGQMGR
jgi:hypothetical protein